MSQIEKNSGGCKDLTFQDKHFFETVERGVHIFIFLFNLLSQNEQSHKLYAVSWELSLALDLHIVREGNGKRK